MVEIVTEGDGHRLGSVANIELKHQGLRIHSVPAQQHIGVEGEVINK